MRRRPRQTALNSKCFCKNGLHKKTKQNKKMKLRRVLFYPVFNSHKREGLVRLKKSLSSWKTSSAGGLHHVPGEVFPGIDCSCSNRFLPCIKTGPLLLQPVPTAPCSFHVTPPEVRAFTPSEATL